MSLPITEAKLLQTQQPTFEYVFVGNSIGTTTGGSGTTTIASQFAAASKEVYDTIVNNCVVGEKLSTTITNFTARVGNYAESVTGRPLVVIVVASAGSDVFGDGTTGDSAATAWATIQTFCADVHAIGGKVMISTVPYGDYWGGTGIARNPSRIALNALIRAGTASFDWLWDMELLYPTTTATYFDSSDHQHLSDSGKQIGANSLARVLDSNYNGASPIITGGLTIGPQNIALTPPGGITFASDNGTAGSQIGSAQATRELQILLPGSTSGLKIVASDKSTVVGTVSDAGVWQVGTKLQLGGTTSSFPMLKRNGTIVQARLADDSADAAVTCQAFEASGYVLSGTSIFYFANSGSGVPMLTRNGAVLYVRLGDNSAFAGIVYSREVTSATPTTGQTVTMGDDARDQVANITPAGTLAALTVAFPSNANSINGQVVTLFITQIITAFTLSSSGATFINGASAWVANDCWTFVKLGTTWIRRK